MTNLYTSAQCRELDRIAIVEHGIPGFKLMLRAGRAAFDVLTNRWPEARSITVFCGKGNNAGDGYVIAGLAHVMGLDAQVIKVGAGGLRGDAELARQWAAERGVAPDPAVAAPRGEVLVDALLGTGLNGPPRESFARVVRRINAGGRPVLAVDVPTGLNADTGGVCGEAVRADVTVSFIGPKLGLHTGQGLVLRGELVPADLGVPPSVLNAVPGCPLLMFEPQSLPSLDPSLHKHRAGHLVVVGGDFDMGGAPLMTAEAALRTGTGLVSVVTRAAHRPAMLARRPEIMVRDADDTNAVAQLLDRATALAIGPGIGGGTWGEQLFRMALATPKPTLIDADGLRWLARLANAPDKADTSSRQGSDCCRGHQPQPHQATPARVLRLRGEEAPGVVASANPSQDPARILTPHSGEAAQLLGTTVAEIERDRPGAAQRLAKQFGAVVVLKGAGTICAARCLLGVCGHGNPGMATAGMGDVLSGVIGGLLAQGLNPPQAATEGTSLHGRAADLAAERRGQRGLVATDLFETIPELLR